MKPKILAAAKEKLYNQFKAEMDLRIEQYDLHFNTIFIPPEGGDKPNAEEGKKFKLISTMSKRLIDEDEDTPSPIRSLVLLGDSGMGKTSVSFKFCDLLWKDINQGWALPIPIYVYLPQYKNFLNTEFLVKVLENAYIDIDHREALFSKPLLIILDGFDEVSIKTNLYTTLGFDQPGRNIKMLITCRPEALLHDDVADLFEVDTNDPDINTYETLYLQPFKKELIEKYFEAYLKDKYPLGEDIASSSQAQPLTVKTYMDWLDRLPSLKALVTNPFLLYVTAKTLPTIIQDLPIVEEGNYAKPNNNHMTQNKLFEFFLHDWFLKQAKRVKNEGFLVGMKKEYVAAYMLAYAQNLANSLVGENGLLNNDLLKEEDCLQPWLVEPIYNDALMKSYRDPDPQLRHSRFFCETDKKGELTPTAKKNLEAIRSGCLFRTEGNRFQFLHKSITEYLAGQEREKLLSKYCFIVENQLSKEGRKEAPPMVLIKEIGILKSLAETANENPKVKEFLEKLIIKSKEIPGLHIAAANAITILNRAGVDFIGRDFSDIQIPGADLSGGRFIGVNFKGADLSNVNFRHANLMESQWQGANAEGIDFGEKANIHARCPITSMAAYSPSPEILHWLVGCIDGFVYRYDDKSGNPIREYQHKGIFHDLVVFLSLIQDIPYKQVKISAIAVHSQSHLLVTAGNDNILWLWSLETNKVETKIFLGYSLFSIINNLAISSDGHWLTAGYDQRLYLWSLINKTMPMPIEVDLGVNVACYTSLTRSVFSPDSKYLAIGTQIESHSNPTFYEINLFKLSNPLIRTENLLPRTEKEPSTFTFSPNGKWFVYSVNDEIYLMQMPQKIIVKCLGAHTNTITNLTFTKDSAWLASGSLDNSIRLWRMPQCEFSFVLQNDIKFVDNLTFSPDGQYLAGTHQSREYAHTPKRKGEIISFWQMPQGIMGSMGPPPLKLKSIAFSPESALLATASDKSRLQYLYLNQGEIILNSEVYNSSEGYELLLMSDLPRSCPAKEKISKRGNIPPQVKDLCISSNGKWLAIYTTSTKIQLWHMGEPALTLKMPDGLSHQMRKHYYRNTAVSSMAFSPDGSWFAARAIPNCIVLWRIPEETPALTLENCFFPITFSQDSTLLVTSDDDGVSIWNLPQGDCKKRINTSPPYKIDHERSSNILAITPKKDWLVTTRFLNKRLILWCLSDGKEGPELRGHKQSITHLAMSPQEKSWIASGSEDMTVCLWSIPEGKLLYTFFFGFEIALLMIHKEKLYVGNYYGFLVCIHISDPFMENFKPNYLWSVGSYEKLLLGKINITETLNLSHNNKALCKQRGSMGTPHVKLSAYQAWCSLFKPIPGTVAKGPSLHDALIVVAGEPIHTLTHASWLVSIVRKRKDPEHNGWFDFFNSSSFDGGAHIFFVIEGIKNHRRFIIRAELFEAEESNTAFISLKPIENLEEFRNDVVNNIYQANQFEVKAETGETLLRNIQADQQKTILYSRKGDGGSNSNNTIETHSCVSWCRKHIVNIKIPMPEKWHHCRVMLPRDVALPEKDHGSSSSARIMKKSSS